MNTQANEVTVIDFSAVVRGIVTYAASSETIERAQSARFESRKIVADFVRTAHGKQWKAIQKPIKSAIDSLAVGIVADKVGLLGVIKTCCEYGIMPTTLNADRLRKAKTWTDLNGKTVPNTYGKEHKEKATAPATTAPAMAKVNSKASGKSVTPQKASEVIHPLTSSVSSSEAPISAREHFGTLWMQLAKNEVFKHEFLDMLAASLEVPRATLTNVMWQSAEQIIRWVK